MMPLVFVAVYILMLRSAQRMTERVLEKQRLSTARSGLDASDIVGEPKEEIQREIAETFLQSRVDTGRSLNNAVQHYDMLLDEAGYTGMRRSLIVEEGRVERLSPVSSKTLAEIVIDAASGVSLGEVEPMTLPIRLRPLIIITWVCYAVMALMPAFSIFIYRTIGTATSNGITRGALLDYERLSFGIVGVFILGYMSLRELGFFPLPLFRGECSAEKTRVFHGFRWKTFEPGRDLAIVRFTSDQEADIAFLGADGSHATVRVGGKYLDHFIACWASPANGI